MSEELVLKIFKDFDTVLNEYKTNKTGMIAEYFTAKGVKDIKYLKHQPKNPKDNEAVGFGQKKGNQCHGLCILKFGTKNYYIGDYKNNQKYGNGYHHFENGLVYRGRYENDKKVDGEVFEPKTGKIVYQGGWGFDVYHGYGKLNRLNDQYYHGDFQKGKFHGKGKLGWPNGDYYEGDMVNNVREGTGVFHFANSDRYEGAFSRNKFNGQGKYIWTNGDYYEGEFVDGKINGNGDMNFNIGVVCSGIWNNNKTQNVDFDPNKVPDTLQHEYLN